MALAQRLLQPIDHPGNALFWLQLLAAMPPGTISFAAVRAVIDRVFLERPITVVTMPQTAIRTNVVIIQSGNDIIVLASGTDGTQVPGLLQSWNAPDQTAVPEGANTQFNAAITEILAAMPYGATAPGNTWYLAGHSYGGATVAVLTAYVARQLTVNGLTCWTFGSPRPGDETFQQYNRNQTFIRYFNDGDPVANVPPHANEAPLLFAFLPNSLAAGANAQVQPLGGRKVTATGTVTLTEQQTLPLTVTEPSLLNWVLGQNAFGSNAHAIPEYQARLQLATAPAPPPGPDRSPPQPPDEPLDVSVRALHQIVDTAVRAMPTPTLPAGVPVFTPGPKTSWYTIRHRREGWAVFYQGQQVALCLTKRDARQIARAGNATNTANARLVPAATT